MRGGSVSKPGSIQRQLDPDDMISSNDIERNGLRWTTVDNIRENLYEDEPLIVNTCLENETGIHWIVLILIANEVLIIDPLGPNNKRPHDDVMRQQLQGFTINFYNGEIQYEDRRSVQCGWYAILISKKLENVKTIDDAIEILDSLFDRKATDDNLRTLIDHFGLRTKK